MSEMGPLRTEVAGLTFSNPVLLAAGTAGYGDELAGVVDLDRLGGLVTKAVSRSPRDGAPAPRVAEFAGGMLNAVGLANPGVERVCEQHLPWLAHHLLNTRKIVNVVGFAVEEFADVVRRIEAVTSQTDLRSSVDAFEVNVSCPNVKEGGLEFGASARTLTAVVETVRAETTRPVFVKLSPALPDIAESARVAAAAGAHGLSLVNTMPGLLIDVDRRKPALGFGTGGMSGPALLPIGVLATWKVRRAVPLPIIGVGGIQSATDALQYMMAGASLVAIGTAALQNPALPARIVRDLERWCGANGISRLETVTGSLDWT